MSARMTVSKPDCPAWCEVSAEEHEAEAHDPRSLWFTHQVNIVDHDEDNEDIWDDGDRLATVRVVTCQSFEEHPCGDLRDEPVILEVYKETLTVAEAEELIGYLTRAVLALEESRGGVR